MRFGEMISRIRRGLGAKYVSGKSLKSSEIAGAVGFGEKHRLRKRSENYDYRIGLYGNESCQRARVRLYRFLIDSIPALNAAIWTWTTLSASPITVEINSTSDEGMISEGEQIVGGLFDHVYDNRYQKFAAVESLLVEFFNSLFSTGSVAGEVIANPERDGIDHFYFIDTSSLGFKLEGGYWKIYQDQEGKKVWFDLPSSYFYGLYADSVNPSGSSILTSVPFVARVEQQLLNDMHKSMHNAGYHRIHVKVTPPDRLPGESENSYIGRANGYFEKTAGMFKDFRPEDNPITWDDVQIEYIGPSAKISASSSWYVNHKAIIEDICAGTHLAPFMLGYPYVSSHNWALFKYEMMQREIRSVQQAAIGFLEWLANLELALKGLEVSCRIHFKNEVVYGLNDKMAAEETRIKTIIMKKEAGLIDTEEARRELEYNQTL
jgi:hypothetical protein